MACRHEVTTQRFQGDPALPSSWQPSGSSSGGQCAPSQSLHVAGQTPCRLTLHKISTHTLGVTATSNCSSFLMHFHFLPRACRGLAAGSSPRPRSTAEPAREGLSQCRLGPSLTGAHKAMRGCGQVTSATVGEKKHVLGCSGGEHNPSRDQEP